MNGVRKISASNVADCDDLLKHDAVVVTIHHLTAYCNCFFKVECLQQCLVFITV